VAALLDIPSFRRENLKAKELYPELTESLYRTDIVPGSTEPASLSVLFGGFFQKIGDRERIGYFLHFFSQAQSQHIPSSLLFDVLKLMVV
jgi:hypothetical protein